jgi:DNA invertase Pin-like site-specific DNA recombinase
MTEKSGIGNKGFSLSICLSKTGSGGEMAIYGYGRCSTAEQDLTGQLDALKGAGCVRTYAEKISGARSDRPQLAKLLKALQNGDIVIVTRLDRLARSTLDLLHILDTIAKTGAGFKVLDNPALDTTSPHGQLLVSVLAAIASDSADHG